jgi:hypothetical protein
VPRYLPVRGELVMRETLDAFRPEESRSFLMILNAIEDLLQAAPGAADPGQGGGEAGEARAALARLTAAWQSRKAALSPSPDGVGALERGVLAGLERRLDPAARSLEGLLGSLASSGGDGPRLAASFAAMAAHACAAWSDPPARRPAELLLELELALLLIEAWVRLSDIHIRVRAHA